MIAARSLARRIAFQILGRQGVYMELSNLLSITVSKIISPQSGLYRKLQFIWYRISAATRLRKLKLLQFGVKLTEHCNLNCAYCGVFSPLAKEGFYSVDVFKKDCERISRLTGGKIWEIQLAGGEPLLHPAVTDFLTIARSNFAEWGGGGRIYIITNGLLLLKQPDSFWQCCNKNAIEISITRYPIKLDIDKITEKAKSYGVKLTSMYDTDKIGKNMHHLPFDLNGGQNIKKSFNVCFFANYCITLKNGKLCTCGLPLSIQHFNEYFGKNIQVSEKDFIDIYKANTIDEILDFLRKPIPFCRYCDWQNIETRLPWRISKKEISEWT
jgi:MoaA/NifB/PqqE/SkfB family radical SAM enzyme